MKMHYVQISYEHNYKYSPIDSVLHFVSEHRSFSFYTFVFSIGTVLNNTGFLTK